MKPALRFIEARSSIWPCPFCGTSLWKTFRQWAPNLFFPVPVVDLGTSFVGEPGLRVDECVGCGAVVSIGGEQ